MRIVLLVVVLTLVSCQQHELGRTFDDDKLIDVLVEVHLAEGAIAAMHKDSARLYRAKYMRKIAQIFTTTESEIAQNIAALQGKPVELKMVYGSVVEKLNVMQDSLSSVGKSLK